MQDLRSGGNPLPHSAVRYLICPLSGITHSFLIFCLCLWTVQLAHCYGALCSFPLHRKQETYALLKSLPPECHSAPPHYHQKLPEEGKAEGHRAIYPSELIPHNCDLDPSEEKWHHYV